MATSLKTTGVMQLIFAVCALIFESVFTAGVVSAGSRSGCDFTTGAGFWAFLFYLTAGILGVVAGKRQRPSQCLVISYMVMSIITSVVAGLALGFSIATAVEDWTCHKYWFEFPPEYNLPLMQVPIILLILIHLAQLITAIVASAFCCHIFGCKCCSCACCDDQSTSPAYLLPASQLGANQPSVISTGGNIMVTLTPQQQQFQAQLPYNQAQYFSQSNYQMTANMLPNVPIHAQPYFPPPAIQSGPPAPESEGAMPDPPPYTEKEQI